MAGAEGIEPSSMVLETTVLPLYYTPKAQILLHYLKHISTKNIAFLYLKRNS